jgi:hypothetical protein
MTVSLPNPSSRLLRAAVAEQCDLLRHRERLTAERTRLLGELRALDDALAAADRRLEVLTELAGPPAAGGAADAGGRRWRANTNGAAAQEAGDPGQGAGAQDTRPLLRGPAIRDAAVRVLIAQPAPIEALHYRQWFDLLAQAGYKVAGKDPLAVFLTQLSRSPLVRKTSAPGVYEVDRQAPLRIRQRLERLQAELREVTTAAHTPVELGAIRARRHELDLAISQQERALEEALRVLHGHGDAAGDGTSDARAHAG